MTVLTMTHAGRVTRAKAFADLTPVIAIGRGDGKWEADAVPPVSGGETGLIDPIGLVRVTAKDFVGPNPNGSIEVASPSGLERWEVTQTPTAYLRLEAHLTEFDCPGEIVREVAIYWQPTLAEGAAPGAHFWPWEQVVNPGDFFMVGHQAPEPRAGYARTFLDILSF